MFFKLLQVTPLRNDRRFLISHQFFLVVFDKQIGVWISFIISGTLLAWNSFCGDIQASCKSFCRLGRVGPAVLYLQLSCMTSPPISNLIMFISRWRAFHVQTSQDPASSWPGSSREWGQDQWTTWAGVHQSCAPNARTRKELWHEVIEVLVELTGVGSCYLHVHF